MNKQRIRIPIRWFVFQQDRPFLFLNMVLWTTNSLSHFPMHSDQLQSVLIYFHLYLLLFYSIPWGLLFSYFLSVLTPTFFDNRILSWQSHDIISGSCAIVLYLLLLEKHISDNSEDSVYNPTSLVVTSQLVINLESNIPFLRSHPTLFIPSPEIWRHPISAARAQHQSWSHVFLSVVSDVVPTLLCAIPSTSDLRHTLTLLRLHSANLRSLNTSDTPPTSDAVAPTPGYYYSILTHGILLKWWYWKVWMMWKKSCIKVVL